MQALKIGSNLAVVILEHFRLTWGIFHAGEKFSSLLPLSVTPVNPMTAAAKLTSSLTAKERNSPLCTHYKIFYHDFLNTFKITQHYEYHAELLQYIRELRYFLTSYCRISVCK